MGMQNSPARSGIDVGSVIADTYTIEALIGRGGMGAVFLASHKRLPGKQVAIKMLHAEMSGAEVLARFRREAEIASRLGHPNIVTVHDFNVLPDGTPYLVLEYLHGESLAQRLSRGPIPLDQAMSITRQVGSALAAAHREGIVHRDLKPQNIFLVPTEVDGRIVEIAKVLDFGISKIRGSQTVKTQDSALLGTPQYMAPEQATGQHKNVDERTDVFALGAIVYEMLAGHPAFTGETIPEVVFKVVYEQPSALAGEVPALPEAIITAVHRAMAKQANDRYPTVSGFVEALTGQPLMVGRPTSIPPPELGFANGSRAPNTGNDAFAQTMGSGDHGSSPVGTHRPAEPLPIVGGNAPTVASQDGASPLAGTISATRTMADPAKPRSHTLLVATVLGGAAIAAVTMYFVMRDRGETQQPVARAPEPPPHVEAPPAHVEPPPPNVEPPSVAAQPEPPKGSAAKPVATKPAKATAVKDEEDGGDETASAKLRDAMDALGAGKLGLAETDALGVATSEYANARQRARGYMIYGIARCRSNDQEKALTALRQINAYKAFRKRLLEACHQAGYLENEH